MTESPVSSEELAWLDATAQAELVRRGLLTPRELVEAAIERIERLNGTLNAVITPLYEKLSPMRRRPGCPMARSAACRCC